MPKSVSISRFDFTSKTNDNVDIKDILRNDKKIVLKYKILKWNIIK